MNRDDYERYYLRSHRWRVDFNEVAYDGGVLEYWTQYYRTKIGARISMFWNLRIASWGGNAQLSKVIDS